MVIAKQEFERLADDLLQHQLGQPDEHGLIEILNKYEYQLHIEQSSQITMSTFGDGGQERRKQISILHDHLTRRQGGTFDRFGLRHFSRARLEQLQLDTQRDLSDLEAQGSSPMTSGRQPSFFEGLFKGVSEIALGSHPTRYQIFVKRKLLSEIAIALKHDSARPAVRTEPNKAELKAQYEKQLLEIDAEKRRIDTLPFDGETKQAMKNALDHQREKLREKWSQCF